MNARVHILDALQLPPQQEINQSWSDEAFAAACRVVASTEPRNHAQLVLLLASVEKSVGAMDQPGMGAVQRHVEDALGAADFVFGGQS